MCVHLRAASLLLILLALPACTSIKRGDVHGRITYQNKPVLYGSVVLIGADNMPVTGRINPDGTYSVASVPAGPARVAVVSPDPAPPWLSDQLLAEDKERRAMLKKQGIEAPPKPLPVTPEIDRRKWFPLPQQYEVADTSGITTTIHSGENAFDIELK